MTRAQTLSLMLKPEARSQILDLVTDVLRMAASESEEGFCKILPINTCANHGNHVQTILHSRRVPYGLLHGGTPHVIRL